MARAASGVSYITSTVYLKVSGLLSWLGVLSETSSGKLSFREELEEAYPGLVFPNFSPFPLRQTVLMARNERKPILIYLHDPCASEAYVREVLSSPRIVEMLNANFMVWGSLSTSEEGQILKQALRIGAPLMYAVYVAHPLNSPSFELIVRPI